MKKIVAILVIGLVAGAAGGYASRPALDAAIRGDGEEIEALVVTEREEEGRLVLTLRSGEETLLATFRARAEDVAELVAPGDRVVIRVSGTGVFVDDAPILRVLGAGEAGEHAAEVSDGGVPEGDAEVPNDAEVPDGGAADGGALIDPAS